MWDVTKHGLRPSSPNSSLASSTAFSLQSLAACCAAETSAGGAPLVLLFLRLAFSNGLGCAGSLTTAALGYWASHFTRQTQSCESCTQACGDSTTHPAPLSIMTYYDH
jgi:hypothetical protein